MSNARGADLGSFWEGCAIQLAVDHIGLDLLDLCHLPSNIVVRELHDVHEARRVHDKNSQSSGCTHTERLHTRK